ncbi:hypothetical protein M9458_056067, partial [Cirrhinus mrigala]
FSSPGFLAWILFLVLLDSLDCLLDVGCPFALTIHLLHVLLTIVWILHNKLFILHLRTEFILVVMTEQSDHTMDSASALELQEFMSLNNARMDQQEEHSLATGRAVQALVAQVSELTSQLQQLRWPAVPPQPSVPPQPTNAEHQPEPRLPTPEPYVGEPKLCRVFLTKCSMFFSLQPRTFAMESSKVALVLTLLSGRAAYWGMAVWENQHPCCSLFQALSEEMKQVFDSALAGREVAQMLADLRQGSKTEWDMFLHGLADCIQKEIFALELPADLDGLIDLALQVDARLQRRDQLGHHTLVSEFPARPVTPHSTKNPCRRKSIGERKDYAFLVELPATSWWTVQLLSGRLSLERFSSTNLLPVRLQ